MQEKQNRYQLRSGLNFQKQTGTIRLKEIIGDPLHKGKRYATIEADEKERGFYRSRDRGDTWESAMGSGLNTQTKQADQWAYGPIAQYNHLLAADARPLTVYALNGILMLMAFPIGFALLVFNILGGENLRTTAHAIALTGLGTALSAATGTGTALFGI